MHFDTRNFLCCLISFDKSWKRSETYLTHFQKNKKTRFSIVVQVSKIGASASVIYATSGLIVSSQYQYKIMKPQKDRCPQQDRSMNSYYSCIWIEVLTSADFSHLRLHILLENSHRIVMKQFCARNAKTLLLFRSNY